MSDDSLNNGQLRFSVDSSLLFQLGEQLVAKSSVALAELVKNAYDADATEVTVTLENIGKSGGTIIIRDNGHGMTFEEIERGWMRIATNNKRINQMSREYRRPLTGAKGIGRFAARRLGKELVLLSIAELPDGTKEEIGVQFNWKHFEEGADITQVPVTYKRREASPDAPTGVTLEIYDARDAWNEDEISALKRDLFSLQSPFPDLIHTHGVSDDGLDPGFNFEVEIVNSGELEKFSGNLWDEFLNFNWACLEGAIDKDGMAQYTINIQEVNSTDSLADDSEKYPDALTDVAFRIYYFVDLRSEDFSDSPLTLRDFRRKINQENGVRVYLDGFRVFPYGEEGNDWLSNDFFNAQNVDMASQISMSEAIKKFDQLVRSSSSESNERPYLRIPRNRQLFGAVYISRVLHPEIEITASREGLIENEVFEGLKRFVQRGLYWLTLKYSAEFIKEQKKQVRESKAKTERPPIQDRLENIRKEMGNLTESIKNPPNPAEVVASPTNLSDDEHSEINSGQEGLEFTDEEILSLENDVSSTPPEPETASTRIIEYVEEQVRRWDEELADIGQQRRVEELEQISEIAMLRLLASAGTTLLLMQHQLRSVIDGIGGVASDLRRLEYQIPKNISATYSDITSQVEEWHKMVHAMMQQLGFLLAPDNRQRRKRQVLHEIVEDVQRPMEYYMTKYNVHFSNKVPPDLRTPPVYQAELYAVLLNILSNALKAVYGHADRNIRVSAYKDSETLYIVMENTGNRVPENMREKFFEPFETTSTPNPVLGVGTGLGLTVVRDTVEFYGGTVRFIDVESPWQTGIEIVIPYR